MIVLEFNNGLVIESANNKSIYEVNLYNKPMENFRIVIDNTEIPLTQKMSEYMFFEGLTLNDVMIKAQVVEEIITRHYIAKDKKVKVKQKLTEEEYTSLETRARSYYEAHVEATREEQEVVLDINGNVISGPVVDERAEALPSDLGFELVERVDLDFKGLDFKWEEYMISQELGSKVLEAHLPTKVSFELLHELANKAYKTSKFSKLRKEHNGEPIEIKFNEPLNKKRGMYNQSLLHNVNVYKDDAVQRFKLVLDNPEYFNIEARNKYEAEVLIESLIRQYEEYFSITF